MERLTITTSEPTTVGQLKAFLAKFPDDTAVAVSKHFDSVDFGVAGSLETGETSITIAPRGVK